MLTEDRELFIRKIGKDVQDEKMVEGRTLMLVSVIVGLILTLFGLFAGAFLNIYIFIVMGVGLALIILGTTWYYCHRKAWEKKSFQVIGYYELDRVRTKIRDNDITEEHDFDKLTIREKLIYYTFDLDYLNVLEDYQETRDVPVKIKGKIEYRPKEFNVKKYSLTYNDGSKKEITNEDDHFNELIMDYIYKEPVKATDKIVRAE